MNKIRRTQSGLMKAAIVAAIIFVVIVIGFALAITLSPSVSATEMKADSFRVYGFARMELPNELSRDYKFSWARVGVMLYPKSTVLGQHFLVRADYDLSKPAMKCFFGQLDKKLVGGKLSLFVGYYLNPVNLLWPVAQQVRTPRWPDAEGNLPGSVMGTAIAFSRSGARLDVAHYNGDGFTVVGGYRGLSYFWVKNVAQGSVWTHPFSNWLNPSLGVTSYEEEKFPGKGEVWFAQNYIQFPKGLRLYATYDFGNTEESGMATLDWAYAQYSSLRVSYDGREDGVVRSEMTFSF
jgi:hypothetical protein